MKRCLSKPSSLSTAAFVFFLAGSAAATTGNLLIPNAGTPPWVCSFSPSGNTMVQPISASSSFALGGSGGGKLNPRASYPVYIIFMGPDWTTDGTSTGPLTSVAQNMIIDAKTIIGSPYLSGVTQYGSAGVATFGGYYVDACTNPRTFNNGDSKFYETNRAITSHADCPNPKQTQWAADVGTKDISNSAIFVEVRDNANGPGGTNDFSGPDSNGNAHCPIGSCGNTVLASPANVIDDAVNPAPDSNQAGEFSWVLSHELVERMSTGMLASIDECKSPGASGIGQIADGEPEDFGYSVSIGSGNRTPVTVYWSVMDQAFIAPGANLPNTDTSIDARILAKGVVNVGEISLRQGLLTGFNMGDTRVPSGFPLDKGITEFAYDQSSNVYDLTGSGQVRKMGGSFSSPSWTAITGSNTFASQIVAPTTGAPCQSTYKVVGGGLFALMSNDGNPAQVWQYSGSGSNWTALTGTNTDVSAFTAITTGQCSNNVATSTTSVYMMAANSAAQNQVWEWSGSGQNWNAITGTNTNVGAMAAAGGNLYMMARNSSQGPFKIFQYVGPGTNWTAISPSTFSVSVIGVAGDMLTIEASNNGQGAQLFQYVPPAPGVVPSASASNWTPVTGTNTALASGGTFVQDGVDLFLLGNNGGGNQVFEFQGIASQVNSTLGWLPLTQPSTFNVTQMDISGSDIVQIFASQNGGPQQFFNYQGSPNNWSPSP